MKSVIVSLSILTLLTTAALADPIADRKAIMKERGGLVGSLAPIMKGEQPFEAAKVDEVFKALAVNAEKIDVAAHFPEGSEMGGDTKASPKIWDEMAAFKKATDEYTADAKAAAAASPQDIAAFKTEFGKVTAHCKACHQEFKL